MEGTVCFRDFEERDIDFVYKCKNTETLWEFTIGSYRKFSYEDVSKWVQGCMRCDPKYKFWAICKNDENRDIVGWCSVTNIDYSTKTALGLGVVIANPEYNDGFTLVESVLYVFHYVFETLGLNKLTVRFLPEHPVSRYCKCFMNYEKTMVNAVVKNGISHDVECYSISREVYFSIVAAGNSKIREIIRKVISNYKASPMA